MSLTGHVGSAEHIDPAVRILIDPALTAAGRNHRRTVNDHVAAFEDMRVIRMVFEIAGLEDFDLLALQYGTVARACADSKLLRMLHKLRNQGVADVAVGSGDKYFALQLMGR